MLVAELSLDLDMAAVEADYAAFESEFKLDVASRLGVGASRVAIRSVRAGSVIVTFAVLADLSGTATTMTELAAALTGAESLGGAAVLGSVVAVTVPTNGFEGGGLPGTGETVCDPSSAPACRRLRIFSDKAC